MYYGKRLVNQSAIDIFPIFHIKAQHEKWNSTDTIYLGNMLHSIDKSILRGWIFFCTMIKSFENKEIFSMKRFGNWYSEFLSTGIDRTWFVVTVSHFIIKTCQDLLYVWLSKRLNLVQGPTEPTDPKLVWYLKFLKFSNFCGPGPVRNRIRSVDTWSWSNFQKIFIPRPRLSKSLSLYHHNCYHYLCRPVFALLRHLRTILNSLPMMPNLSNLLLSNHNKYLGCKLPYLFQNHHKAMVCPNYMLVLSHEHHQNMIYHNLTIDPILAIHQDMVEI